MKRRIIKKWFSYFEKPCISRHYRVYCYRKLKSHFHFRFPFDNGKLGSIVSWDKVEKYLKKQKIKYMKKKIFAVKRGNHPLQFMGIPLDAPAIFVKNKKEDNWEWFEGCHDSAIIEVDLQELLEKCEVEHFYEDSKYFEDDEQIGIDNVNLKDY